VDPTIDQIWEGHRLTIGAHEFLIQFRSVALPRHQWLKGNWGRNWNRIFQFWLL